MNLRLPPPWLLVLVGLVLNIFALLISSVVIDKLAMDIAVLSTQRDDNIRAIEVDWTSIETLERKRENSLLHLQLSSGSESSAARDQVIKQLSIWLNQPIEQVPFSDLEQLMGSIDQAQQIHRERIDEYYLQNLALAETMAKLENESAHYKNIALFLQVFGLALILARDLSRRS